MTAKIVQNIKTAMIMWGQGTQLQIIILLQHEQKFFVLDSQKYELNTCMKIQVMKLNDVTKHSL